MQVVTIPLFSAPPPKKTLNLLMHFLLTKCKILEGCTPHGELKKGLHIEENLRGAKLAGASAKAAHA